MGYALAAAAAELGADVTLISGPTGMTPPAGVRVVPVETTADLHRATVREFAEADCLIMAAAPSDYRPAQRADKKLKRSGPLQLDLEPTTDILKDIAGKRKKGQVVVGFALETDHGVENARKKLTAKKLDLIVLNVTGPDSGFGTDTNRVTLLQPRKKPEAWPVMPKDALAFDLIARIAALLE